MYDYKIIKLVIVIVSAPCARDGCQLCIALSAIQQARSRGGGGEGGQGIQSNPPPSNVCVRRLKKSAITVYAQTCNVLCSACYSMAARAFSVHATGPSSALHVLVNFIFVVSGGLFWS